jgi:hypothetical protein
MDLNMLLHLQAIYLIPILIQLNLFLLMHDHFPMDILMYLLFDAPHGVEEYFLTGVPRLRECTVGNGIAG